MDFGEVLQTAKQNGGAKPQIQYYSTKFAPPKKEQRNKTVSVNIQNFLARKEAEEKQKMEEARRRKERLLELRSQDKKATRRVNVMLKRTKSASQAVIDDARDSDNTAVTLVGPSQPDEDDYGYVSKESEELYNKMMEKYSKMPDESKFNMEKKRVSTNLSSTKERVMAALERERLEATLPHRRKRKHATEEISEKCESSPIYEDEKDKKKEKPKFKPAPPVNFDELLKLAAKKQHEPIVIEPKKVEEERLLTKKQKKEFEREREWKERKDVRGKPVPDNRTPLKIPKSNGTIGIPPKDGRIPKKTDNKVPNPKPDMPLNPSKHGDKNLSTNAPRDKRVEKIPQKSSDKDIRGSVTFKKPDTPINNKNLDNNYVSNNSSINKSRLNEKNGVRPNEVRKSNFGTVNNRPNPVVPNGKPKDLQKRPVDTRPKITDTKPKSFPSKDLKPKQFPSSDLKPKQFPPKEVKRKPLVSNKRRIIDDEEEYDSEMDDFIDDGPEEEEDYSSIIGQIFGYDKRKYKVQDEDIDNMESSFAQQMREECISTKIGIKEDLEDMQREEEEKKMKAMRLKKQRRL